MPHWILTALLRAWFKSPIIDDIMSPLTSDGHLFRSIRRRFHPSSRVRALGTAANPPAPGVIKLMLPVRRSTNQVRKHRPSALVRHVLSEVGGNLDVVAATKNSETARRPSSLARRRLFPLRYARLHQRLLAATGDEVTLSLFELDDLIEGGLPANSRTTHHEWWTNNPARAYARSWLSAGWTWDGHARTRGGSATLTAVAFRRGIRAPLDIDELQKIREQQARYFADQLRHLSLRGWDDSYRRIKWDQPHLVYQVHLPEQGLFKVGLTRVGTRRLTELARGRELVSVETVTVDNRFEAQLVEIAALRLTDPWRQLIPLQHSAAGYTEMWSDQGPTVDLSALVEELRDGASQPGRTLRRKAT